MKPLIQVQGVSQRFSTASGEFLALQNVSFDIHEGETVSLIGHSGCGKSTLLNLIAGIRSTHGIRQIHWQGDTQALSLTSPGKGNSSDGWSVIMPAWNEAEGATNRWHLSAVVEDEKGQRVSSNEITLAVVQPLIAIPDDDPRWKLLPDE